MTVGNEDQHHTHTRTRTHTQTHTHTHTHTQTHMHTKHTHMHTHTQLSATAELSLEATYYNIHHDAWEPLLEPVVNPENENVYTSWILKAEVRGNVQL